MKPSIPYSWVLPEEDTYFRKMLAQTPQGFELDHLEFALQHVPECMFAIDGGAHIGTWTRVLAHRFYMVAAFEPAVDTFECLVKNTKDLENVYVKKAALGPVNGLCRVMNDPDRPGNSGARMVAPQAEGRCTMVALDSYDFRNVSFLKLDVEGFEHAALQGAVKTIKYCKPTIMIECKKFVPPRHGGPEKAIQFLNDLGYKGVGGIRNDQVFVPA